MTDSGNDNELSYEKLNWIIDHSDDGLFLVIASARMQHEVATRYERDSVAIFDFNIEKTPFQVGSFSQLLERAPGKRAYFFVDFQLAVSNEEDVERFNFCRDILARKKLNLVFFVNQETNILLNRNAKDIYSFIQLFIPFKDSVKDNEIYYSSPALYYLKKDKPIRKKLLFPGENLLAKALALSNTAKTLKDEGDYESALAYYQLVLAIRQYALGENHRDTADTLDKLGNIYGNLGKFYDAKTALEEALHIRKVINSPLIFDTYDNLGHINYELGCYDEALEYYQKALMKKEEVLGANHPNTAITYAHLAELYRDIGNYSKALEYSQKAVAINENALGFVNSVTAASYANLASVYESNGDYTKALEYSMKVVDINKEIFGTDRPETAASYANTALIYGGMGDYNKALTWFIKANIIIEKVLGKDQPKVAANYIDSALTFAEAGDYRSALDCFDKALAIYKHDLGPNHPYTATGYHNLAVVYYAMKDYQKALEYAKEAFNVFDKSLSTNHPFTRITCHTIAIIYRQMNQHHEADYWMHYSSGHTHNNDNSQQ